MSTTPILTYTVDEGCDIAGIRRTALYKAIGTGELVARKYGRKTLILASDLHRFIEGLPTIVPKPIDQTKKDGLRNSRRLSETNFIISPNSANSHIPERNTLMRIDKPHTIDRDSKPSDQNENKCRYHSRNVTETNLISSPEPAFQPTK